MIVLSNNLSYLWLYLHQRIQGLEKGTSPKLQFQLSLKHYLCRDFRHLCFPSLSHPPAQKTGLDLPLIILLLIWIEETRNVNTK